MLFRSRSELKVEQRVVRVQRESANRPEAGAISSLSAGDNAGDNAPDSPDLPSRHGPEKRDTGVLQTRRVESVILRAAEAFAFRTTSSAPSIFGWLRPVMKTFTPSRASASAIDRPIAVGPPGRAGRGARAAAR